MGSELLFSTLVFAAAVLIGLGGALFRRRAQVDALRAMGLETTLGGATGEGRRQGVPVRVTYFWLEKNRYNRELYMRIEAGGVSPSIGLVAQGLGQRLLKGLGAQDVEVGDPRFDEAVVVRGDEARIRALLSAQARDSVRFILGYPNAEIVDGWVRYTELGTEHPTQALRYVDRAVEVALQLSPERQGRERLLEQVEGDRSPGVRQRCLLELWERGPRELLERAVSRAAEDEDDRVVGTAALIRGDGPRILQQHMDVIDAAVSIAPQRTCRALGEAGAEDELIRLLSDRRDVVKVSAARGLARAGGRRAVEALRPLVNGVVTDPEIKSAARSALAAVQARLQGNATAGSVSLVDAGPSAGAVSLSEERGGLSLAPPRPAREG